MSIGLILPSRGRPEGLKKSLKSIVDNSYSSNLKVYIYLDDNDQKLDQYKTIINKFERIVDLTIGQPIGVPKSFNLLASKVQEKYIMMFNDDLEIKTNYWDKHFLDDADKINDQIFVAFFNDGINFNKHAAFPIISKKWFNLVGYSSKNLIFQHNDTWVFSIGVMLRRTIYYENIKLKHNHGYLEKKYLDETFLLNRNKIKIFFDHLIFSFLFISRFISYIKLYKIKKDTFAKNIYFQKKSPLSVEINNLKETLISAFKIYRFK